MSEIWIEKNLTNGVTVLKYLIGIIWV